MVLKPFLFLVPLVLLSFISQLKACGQSLVTRITTTAQLPYDAIDYLSEESFWVVLSNKDAKGSTKQLDFGKLSDKDVVKVTITSNRSKTSETTYTYSSNNSIKKADGSTVYFFICSDTMIGLVECKDSKSEPLLFSVAKMINTQSDVSGEIDSCMKRMSAIHPGSTIQQLAHP